MGVYDAPTQLREMLQFFPKGQETMNRRAYVGGAVVAWPLTAFGKAPRIAIVLPSQPVSEIAETNDQPFWQAVFNELRRVGYVEAQNLLIERYSGEGRATADLARNVVSRNPDLITGAAVDVGKEQWSKRIQLLRQVVPQATRFAYLETRALREKFGALVKEGEVIEGITWVGPPLNHPINEAEYRRVFAALTKLRLVPKGSWSAMKKNTGWRVS